MKSPRRLELTSDLIEKHNLSVEPPPPNSIFWTMWDACADIANASLNTRFIEGIRDGNLNPVLYGGYNVSDAYYCFNGASDYLDASQRAGDQALKDFLTQKYNSYQNYNSTFPKVWHVQDGSSIVPFSVVVEYSEFEMNVAKNANPIYCLIAMLPCEYLWASLAQTLSPPASGNLYAEWITGNADASGAYTIGNYLDCFQAQYPGAIDQAVAVDIYRQAMNYELQNFLAGGGQADK